MGGEEWPDSCSGKLFLVQGENGLEEARLQARAGCGIKRQILFHGRRDQSFPKEGRQAILLRDAGKGSGDPRRIGSAYKGAGCGQDSRPDWGSRVHEEQLQLELCNLVGNQWLGVWGGVEGFYGEQR